MLTDAVLLITIATSAVGVLLFSLVIYRKCTSQTAITNSTQKQTSAAATAAIYNFAEEFASTPQFTAKDVTDPDFLVIRDRRKSTNKLYADAIQEFHLSNATAEGIITPGSLFIHFSNILPVTPLWAERVWRLLSPSGNPLTRAALSDFLSENLPTDSRLFFVFTLYDLNGDERFSETEFSALLKSISMSPSIHVLARLFRTPVDFDQFKDIIKENELNVS